ncbi:unnamed protein product [Rotaria sp. Silwood2]|nr:unnamed protein product [Rotaria sp. Silwood2]
MVDVLYSFVNVTQRFDQLILNPLYIHSLDMTSMTMKSYLDRIYSIHNQLLDRICQNILPRIHHQVNELIVEQHSMEHVVHTINYPQLYSLSLIDFQEEILLNYLIDNMTLRKLLTEQITCLKIDVKDNTTAPPLPENLSTIFALILSLCKGLIELNFCRFYHRSSICTFELSSTNCKSSTLTVLKISVKSFDDCLYLLDGRLNCLSTLIIYVEEIAYTLGTIDNTKELPKLKYFSLTSYPRIVFYDNLIIPLLRRMINLEELILFLSIIRADKNYIDGVQLYDDILVYMPRLNKFTFCIDTTIVENNIEIGLSSNEDIQRSFIRKEYGPVYSHVETFSKQNKRRGDSYSLPYHFKILTDTAAVSHATTVDDRDDERREGSPEGGARLTVYGSGFSENHFSLVPSTESPNTIELVRGNDVYDCPMQNEKATDIQLTCYTPRLPEGDYQVRVSVEGNPVPISQYSSPSSATFTAHRNYTPQITNISPASGLPQRLVTLTGDFKTECYLRDSRECSPKNVSVISRKSSNYPLIVNVGDDPCTIRNVNLTTIQCQTSIRPASNRNHYRGGRGLHVYYQPGYINLNALGSASLPIPNANTSRSWTGEASFSSVFSSATTVWLIGFIRAPMTAAFNFRLESNSQAALYLSIDEDPANAVRIASNTVTDSQRIVLQNNTDYYMLCVGSTGGGSFRLAVKSAMQPLNSRTETNRPGTSEIQQVNIGGAVTTEYQRIVYMTNSSIPGVAEVQDVEAYFNIFQIGFRGVYTVLLDGPPFTQFVQDALNDLPTIYPLTVSVALVGTAYRVTFPVEMGDVPPLTVISTGFSGIVNATEITRGVSSASKIAFQLDGAITNYLNFRDDDITSAILTNEFKNLFNIRCPPSLYDPQVAPTIVYSDEFEEPSPYDDTFTIEDMAFCGRGAVRNSTVHIVYGNTQAADYMCFAYKINTGSSMTMIFQAQGDYNSPTIESRLMNLIADSRWHYTCINVLDELQQSNPSYLAVTTVVLMQVDLNYFVPSSIMIDTVTLRNDLPIGYEDVGTVISISNASKALSGYYSIMFDGQVYSPIPAAIAPSNLADLLQSFPNFGYVSVSRTGQCHQYSYTIQWLVNGEQPLISIVNSSQLRPVNAPISVSSIQRGSSSNVFYDLPTDVVRTYHTAPQVEVVVGGYPSYCSNPDNNCEFQWSINHTPQITSVIQSGTAVTISGTGFSTRPESNMISIGENGQCDVQTASVTSILCNIINAPSGQHVLRLNVADKGLASSNTTFMVQVPLFITSFVPNGGDSGGGYQLTVFGGGFSPSAVIFLGENFCINRTVVNFTTIKCVVPPSGSGSLIQVVVAVSDGLNSVTASTQFTYNVTVAPTIYSINPTFVTMRGGLLNINGTGFGNQDVSVFIGTANARVISSSNNYIVVNLNTLPPGLYPVTVRTAAGYARPLFQVEYRFYIQEVLPQVGSAYGGSDVYVNGAGFEDGTIVQLRDQQNNVSPCDIVSIQSDQIHCVPTVPTSQVTITSYGTHPVYGFGYAWYPTRETVQQGTTVTWSWDSSQLSSPVSYKIQQVDSPYSTRPVQNGFDSGPPTSSGSFSYQFDTMGTFYYWAPNITQSTEYAMRGVIDVVALMPKTMTVEAIWNKLTAQRCAFPFIFNSVNYTACTSANDTRLWCSPTSVYTGQRLYCTPTTSVPTSSCPWRTLNASSCGESVPTSSNPTQFLSTICTVESVTDMSPLEGAAGTQLTITGTNFDGNMCDYDIQIGSSYHCPIINMSSNTLTCQITANSTLDARTNQTVRVARHRQGYLSSRIPLKFRFLPSISSISPTIGSIYGGTRVTIDGDGFVGDDTLVYIAGANYAYRGSESYSRITFTTPSELTYIDTDLSLAVFVRTSQSTCFTPSCHFSWATSVTPYFDSVSPSVIRGSTNLTITGQNLLSGGRTAADVHVTINDHICNITQMRNDSIVCAVKGVEAGQHRIVGSIDGVGNAYSSLNTTSEAIVATVTPLTSSVYGGATLAIVGHGFSSNISEIEVNVGTDSCPITSTTSDKVECTIPPQRNNSNTANISITSHRISFPSSSVLTYDRTITPNISSVSPTFGSNSQNLVISGNNFAGSAQTNVTVGKTECTISSHSMGSVACTVGSNLPAGTHEVTVHVDGVGDSNSDISYTQDLSITSVAPSQGGYGGGLPSTILGNGFNGTNITVSVCNRACLSKEIVSNGQLICVTPELSSTAASTACNLTVSVDGISKNTLFTYRANLTATVTSVSPARGGTGGGTTITINGTNFPTSINSVVVTIAGTPCSVRTISTTSITCETGSHPYSSVRAPVMVYINGSGYANTSAQFQYIDLWSSPWTWGGSDPPEEGTLVVIENHVTIFLDIETPTLKVLVIDNSTLIFDDSQDVALNVEYIIIVNGGHLQVGTNTEPFQHRAVITMYGHLRSIELPIFGAKVLALREGTLDMHGIPTVQTWAQLGATAMNGSTTLTLLQPVNWTINSQIVIATTSDRFSQKESEIRRITNISSNGLTLTLDQPLTYTHLGTSQTLNSTTIEIRAEVGLLSHNVVFQGSITETWNDTIEACPAGFNPGMIN